MRCVFDLVSYLTDSEREDWKKLTNNARYPRVYEMDLDAVPMQGDSVSIQFTYNGKVVEIDAVVKRRTLCDERNNLYVTKKCIYWWFSLNEIEVNWFDNLNNGGII